MAMQLEEITRMIKARIPDADVRIEDTVGDGDHYAAYVISDCFRGKSLVHQHQMVYQALGEHMGNQLHALSLKTSVPGRE